MIASRWHGSCGQRPDPALRLNGPGTSLGFRSAFAKPFLPLSCRLCMDRLWRIGHGCAKRSDSSRKAVGDRQPAFPEFCLPVLLSWSRPMVEQHCRHLRDVEAVQAAPVPVALLFGGEFRRDQKPALVSRTVVGDRALQNRAGQCLLSLALFSQPRNSLGITLRKGLARTKEIWRRDRDSNPGSP